MPGESHRNACGTAAAMPSVAVATGIRCLLTADASLVPRSSAALVALSDPASRHLARQALTRAGARRGGRAKLLCAARSIQVSTAKSCRQPAHLPLLVTDAAVHICNRCCQLPCCCRCGCFSRADDLHTGHVSSLRNMVTWLCSQAEDPRGVVPTCWLIGQALTTTPFLRTCPQQPTLHRPSPLCL